MKISKTLLAGVAVTGAASFTLGVTGSVSALSGLPATDTVSNVTNTKQSTSVDASLAGQLGLGLVGSSLLQGGSTGAAADTTAKVGAGVKATNTVSAKDGAASTSTSVGAKANVGANVATSAAGTKTGAGVGVSADATATANTKTDTATPDVTSGLLNGGLLGGSLLGL